MDGVLRGKAEQLASEIATQAKTQHDLNGPLQGMMKSAPERVLDTEMDFDPGCKTLPVSTADCLAQRTAGSTAEVAATRGQKNRRNGPSHKTVLGEMRLTMPSDRDGAL